MRKAFLLASLLILSGGTSCRKKAAAAPGDSLGQGEELQAGSSRPAVVGPVRWWDAAGLCLEVPAGWSGEGRGANGVLLSLVNESSEVGFEIYLAESKPDRSNLARVFADTGTYRDVPALGPVGIESWVSDVPGGPGLHVWSGQVNEQGVRLEARYPFGKSFTGGAQVDVLLRALCVE